LKDKKADPKMLAEVGSMSIRALKFAKELVKPGISFLEVAQKAEGFLKENGFGCAFPINLSVNREAAHYTPTIDDQKLFGNNDVVKIDFGAAKDGVLGDCALTVDLGGSNGDLVSAAETALSAALSVVKAGVKVSDIGKEIERAAESAGFKPVLNLGGHGVNVHDLHSGVFIPNYDNHDETTLEEGDVVAIEPFITDAKKNTVVESDICEIYQFSGNAPVRTREARNVIARILINYPSEPFAVRWLSDVVESRFGLYAAIRELLMNDAIIRHPMLVCASEGLVAQAEAEILVEKDSCKVLTA
jgi:methionyl aminopeptidase